MNRLGAQARARVENPKLVREIVTPEGIPIRFVLARAGDRATAFVLDVIIQLLAIVAIVLGLGFAVGGHQGDDGGWLTSIVVVLAFVILNFYFAVFEVRWQGSTPGKRWVGIRVVDARGGQLETSAVLARNLVRELEVWTPLRFLLAGRALWPDAPGWMTMVAGAWMFVFLFMPLFNKDRLRIGDLIAGTRVVMQPKMTLVPDLVDEQPQIVLVGARPGTAFAFTASQLAVYGIYELQVLEDLLRTESHHLSHFEAIRTVAEKIRSKISFDGAPGDDERFLREFYAALRGHLEQKMLFGQRREDKFAK